MLLTELVRQPETFIPSETERLVMALVLVSDTPQLALSQIDSDEQRYAAMTKLIRLGFLNIDDGGVEITDTGNALAQAQALGDESGPSEMASELAATISQ